MASAILKIKTIQKICRLFLLKKYITKELANFNKDPTS